MLSTSNLKALIAPVAIDMPGTTSGRLAPLLAPPVDITVPEGAREQADCLLASAAVESVETHEVDFGNPCATYHQVELTLTDGFKVSARLIEPQGICRPRAEVPLVLMLHDAGRPVRGWHHMTRFAAIGCAVLALDGGEHASENAEAAFSSLIVPALALVRVGSELPGIDPARVYTWGEGLGGALALAVAAIMPDRIARCAACSPMPLDFTRGSSAVNLVAWAPRVQCAVLLGTGLRDEVAPTEACIGFAHRTGGDTQLIAYPEHAHERINEFENKVLSFLASE